MQEQWGVEVIDGLVQFKTYSYIRLDGLMVHFIMFIICGWMSHVFPA